MTQYVYQQYQALVTDYELRNESLTDSLTYTQFDTVITNRLFTPDQGGYNNDPEDLQIRVSKDVKFYVGENDAASNVDFSFAFKDDNTKAMINTTRSTLNLSADFVEMNSLIINDNASALKISTNKVLQIHSANKTQFIGKAEFSNEVKMDKNLYIGKSLIFQEESYADSNEQVRIALQYNQTKDTLDIVKQVGNGVNAKKKLMSRLGIGGLVGSDDTSLMNVPYYHSPTVASSTFTNNASVFNATNIWKQLNNTLYYATNTNERVGIGLSNVSSTNIFQVSGKTQINNIEIDAQQISGVNRLISTTVDATDVNVTNDINVTGDTFVKTMTADDINFRNNGYVNNFNGNATTMNFDGKYSWLNTTQGDITLSSFSNNLSFISNIHEVPIQSGGKWRMREAGEELHIEKLNGSTWELKFKFT